MTSLIRPPWPKVSPGSTCCRSNGTKSIRSIPLKLAVRHGITGYDAAYLWLAAELRAPLATFDRQLAQAAQTYLSTLQ